MILIGQYDSPFVRRVGIALTLYGLPFEHKPWSIFGDMDKIRPFNPLVRVPVLVLPEGEALIETGAILDYLDGLASPAARLYPASQPERRQAMRIAALAGGISDLAVGLFYELRLHDTVSDVLVGRRSGQIAAALDALERERGDGGFWFGGRIGHADIAVAATVRHGRDAHGELFDLSARPKLAAHCAAMEALPVFQAIQQAFIAPT